MFEMPDDLAQDTLNYLAKQPFIDVVDLINRLQQMKRIESPNSHADEAVIIPPVKK